MQDLPTSYLFIIALTERQVFKLRTFTQLYMSSLQRKGSILQSLTGLIGLLNSPAIAGSNSEQSNGFFLEANIKDIFLEGVDQVHSSCGRPVKKISLSLDDFFDQEDLPSETPADPTAEDKPSQAEGKPFEHAVYKPVC